MNLQLNSGLHFVFVGLFVAKKGQIRFSLAVDRADGVPPSPD